MFDFHSGNARLDGRNVARSVARMGGAPAIIDRLPFSHRLPPHSVMICLPFVCVSAAVKLRV